LFESVVVVAFQSAFHAEIYQNNIFLFLRLTYQNDSKHIKKLIFNKKLNFLESLVDLRFQTLLKSINRDNKNYLEKSINHTNLIKK